MACELWTRVAAPIDEGDDLDPLERLGLASIGHDRRSRQAEQRDEARETGQNGDAGQQPDDALAGQAAGHLTAEDEDDEDRNRAPAAHPGVMELRQAAIAPPSRLAESDAVGERPERPLRQGHHGGAGEQSDEARRSAHHGVGGRHRRHAADEQRAMVAAPIRPARGDEHGDDADDRLHGEHGGDLESVEPARRQPNGKERQLHADDRVDGGLQQRQLELGVAVRLAALKFRQTLTPSRRL
jgi:hypothetical protein